jgi:hypothetical protein
VAHARFKTNAKSPSGSFSYWVDHVIGKIPVRHWTSTLPPGLRYLLSHDVDMSTPVVDIYNASVFRLLQAIAKCAYEKQRRRFRSPDRGAGQPFGRFSANRASEITIPRRTKPVRRHKRRRDPKTPGGLKWLPSGVSAETCWPSRADSAWTGTLEDG